MEQYKEERKRSQTRFAISIEEAILKLHYMYPQFEQEHLRQLVVEKKGQMGEVAVELLVQAGEPRKLTKNQRDNLFELAELRKEGQIHEC